MTVKVQCPNPTCRQHSAIPEKYLGKTVRCGKCKEKFTATAGDTPPFKPSASAETIPAGTTAALDGPPKQIGRFEIRGKLGSGAFGTVYRAYDSQLDREVALKVPQRGTLQNAKHVERFLREAKAAARLRHPHIVPVFQAGKHGEHYYIASTMILGRTLAQATS